MTTESTNQINTIFKWLLWVSISISSFLVANTYNKVDAKMEKIIDKMEAVDARLIRVEYELKLK